MRIGQVYKHYNEDGGAASNRTLDISIPYTVKANSLNEAKALESKNITAKGDFETHASVGIQLLRRFTIQMLVQNH